MSRNPPQRRKARARNGVAPYSPAVFDFRRGAGSAGDGATEAAPPERRLQALVLRHGMEARRAETVYRLRSRQPARTPAVKPGTGRKQKTGG